MARCATLADVMPTVLTLGLGLAAIVTLLVLGARGIRDGDERMEPLVDASFDELSRCVVVRVENPGDSPLLVAARVRGLWWAPTLFADPHVRRTAGRNARLALRRYEVGSVAAGEQVSLLLPVARCDRALARAVRVSVAVGSPGRLRLHCLTVPLARARPGLLAGPRWLVQLAVFRLRRRRWDELLAGDRRGGYGRDPRRV
jgi:hypothetical protein